MNINFRDWSLKTRVTIFTLLVFLVSIWSLTLLLAKIQRDDLVKLLGQAEFSTVTLQAANIGRELEDRLEILKAMAARVTPAMLAQPATQQNLLESQLQFERLFNAGGFIARADGVVTASVPLDRQRLGQNFGDRDFIAGALRDGQATIGKPVKGRLLPAGIIGMAAPIRDAQGTVVGVVAGITNLNEPNFLDGITENPYGKTGGYVLTAPNAGLVITATDKSRIMTALPAVSADPLAQRFRDGIEGYGVGVNQLGVQRLAAAKNIPLANWQLVASLPVAEAFAPVDDLQDRMQLLALLLTVVSGGLTWWWLRRQFMPLTEATESLTRMTAQGQAPQPLAVARRDEIGLLIGGFNRLLEMGEQQKRDLAQERQTLRNVIMGTGAGTWELYLRDGQVVLNERWAGIIGYTLAELEPLSESTWSSKVQEDDLPQVAGDLQRCIAGEIGSLDSMYRMRHKAGHWVWVHTRARVSDRDEQGRPLRLSGTNLDVTSEKLAEEKIARTSALLQAVLDSASGVAVITVGPDHVVSLFNKGAENLLGYSAQEVVGLHTPALFVEPEEFKARAAQARAQGWQRGAVSGVFDLTRDQKTEWTYIHKDGRRLQVAQWVTRLVGYQGDGGGYLAVSYDISREKSYEQSLILAKEQAEQATRAKSQFVSNMSHEIRTPLNAVMGLLQLLQDTDLSGRQLDYINKAEGAAKSLLGLINDILDISKMDAGKMTLDLQPFRLDKLLGELAAILSSSVTDKPLEVLFDVSPLTPRALVGDLMRLKQILINLGGNAIKFTLAGTVVLQVRVVSRNERESTLRFSVIDTGIGITPQQQQFIFDDFSQAEASTTRRFGGSGLGLSICRQLVTLMGGTLTLESEPGKGSTFHFTVTLPHPGPAMLEPEAPAQRLLAPLHVLVVDDNPLAREIMVSIIESWGWTADAADSGAQALALVGERAGRGLPLHQAVLVDWAMPEMDGWETLERLQALWPAGATPLSVMVTAHDREMLRHRAAHESARLDGYVAKPFTASALHDALVEAQASRDGVPTPRLPLAHGQALAGMRILLVEDNLINQQVAQELLASQGAQVIVAANGQAGLDAIAAAEPAFDVVLMDIQMPVMDGLTATRRIRGEMRLPDLPVIAMTANAMASDRQECLDAGMNGHVGKPFDLPHLIEVLLEHTRTRRAPAPALALALAQNGPAAADAPAPDFLDTAAALGRIGGKTGLYGRILQSFLAEMAVMTESFDACLQAGDHPRAASLMHTLKGLAGTVGALYLAALAQASERVLKQGGDAATTAGLAAALREAVAAISGTVAQAVHTFGAGASAPAPSAPAAAADLPAALATLAQLQDLLAQGDSRALQVCERLQALVGGGHEAALQALAQAIGQFDFEHGRDQCQALARALAAQEDIR